MTTEDFRTANFRTAGFSLPAVVRAKALAAGAAQWISDLPELVARLAAEWSITVGRTFDGATEAYVAEATQATQATQASGTAAVLKLHIPRPGQQASNEITTLRLTGGSGCAQLLRADAGRGALLLERLGPSLHELGLPLADRQEILCAAAQQVWRRAPGCGLPTGAQKGRWLIEFITATWAELDRPCSERAVEHALACAQRRIRAHDDERAVLVHGDVHEWNALRAGTGFRLVDPDGLLAEAEYDLGIIMREDPGELLDGDVGGLASERARWLARRCGLDATAIWEWGVVERVSTGLLGVKVGLEPVASQMLAVADRLAARPGSLSAHMSAT